MPAAPVGHVAPSVSHAPPAVAPPIAEPAPIPDPVPSAGAPVAARFEPQASFDQPARSAGEITSPPEPVTKKEQPERKEREVSMAELARDIMSISEQESASATGSNSSDGEDPDTVSDFVEFERQASFDLILKPAPKGGRLRRSKGSAQKEPLESEGFDPLNELGTSPQLDTAGAKNRPRGRIWSR